MSARIWGNFGRMGQPRGRTRCRRGRGNRFGGLRDSIRLLFFGPLSVRRGPGHTVRPNGQHRQLLVSWGRRVLCSLRRGHFHHHAIGHRARSRRAGHRGLPRICARWQIAGRRHQRSGRTQIQRFFLPTPTRRETNAFPPADQTSPKVSHRAPSGD